MRNLKMLQFIHEIAGVPRAGAPLERLEPCEGKPSVPKGGVGGLTACAYPVRQRMA